jgi:hypothetical protein
LRLTFARLDYRQFQTKPGAVIDPKVEKQLLDERQQHLDAADSLIGRIADLDPALETKARLRLAQALLTMSDRERRNQALLEFAKIEQLDRDAPGPRWQLDTREREFVGRMLKPQAPANWWQRRLTAANH